MSNLPWESPKITMIMSIFNGRVASVKQVNVAVAKIQEEQ